LRPTVVVIGLGEVGKPLLELAQRAAGAVFGVDLNPSALPTKTAIDVMHVCFPFGAGFVDEVTRYSMLLQPALTIIDSTVAVGTTRAVHARTGLPIAYSPVRGKHARMLEELTTYRKYVGGIDATAAEAAAEHFVRMGMSTRVVSSPETAELAKLTETTYFSVMIAWAQEVERYCDQTGLEYDEVVSFYEEVSFFPPVKYFPGVIAGHCVMNNIEILEGLVDSDLLRAIKASNEEKKRRGDHEDGLTELAGVVGSSA
jgi:UDP-N-acetyl-D-mannosaminuronate dehydrogenase